MSLLRGVAFLAVRLAPIAIPLQLAFTLPILFATLRLGLPFWITSWGCFVHVIALAAVWGMAAQVMAGERVRPDRALGAALSAWGRLAATMVVGSAHVLFFSLLLVVPGVYKVVGFVAALPVALHEPERDGADALAMSESRVDGIRESVLMTYVGLAVFGFGFSIASVLALVLAHGLAEVPITVWAFHLLVAVASSVGFLPFALLPAVVYAKTRDRVPTYE